jgi:hypothetical protein
MASDKRADADRKSRVGRRIILLSGGFALFVGLVSPDRQTVAYLAAGLGAIVLLIGLQTIGSRRRWLANRLDPRVVLLTTTVCLSLAMSELALRFFLTTALPDWSRKGPAPYDGLGYQHDRSLGWFPMPNDRKVLKAFDRMVTISHNTDGFRDIEPQFDERPRIVFIGDSFLWGSSLEAKERFTDKLRARHPEWAIFNFGVVGYGNDQEYLLLQRHFEKYRPKVVFLIFCTENDFTDNCGNGGGIQVFKPYYTASPEGLRLHGTPTPVPDYVFCQRHRFLSKAYIVRLAMRAWGNLRCPHIRIFQKDITFQILTALNQYVMQHGAKFYVGLTAPERELERFLGDSKIPCIDLSTELRIQGDFHWSAEGNSVVADKIQIFLKEQFSPGATAGK